MENKTTTSSGYTIIETWHPTIDLMWFNEEVTVSFDGKTARIEKVLKQRWYSDMGKEEWREVPTNE